jgi:hypothetical protein
MKLCTTILLCIYLVLEYGLRFSNPNHALFEKLPIAVFLQTSSSDKCSLSAFVPYRRPKLNMVRKRMNSTPITGGHASNREITVTAQQSRYAKDAVDAPASKEVGSVEMLR